jgi:hypothetical protein
VSHSSESLSISFDVTRTRVVLRARSDLQSEFSELAARISPGGQLSPLAAEFDLDEFLAALEELGTWVHGDVGWEESLASLVRDVLDDADTAEALISRPGSPDEEVSPDEIMQLLGADWSADLTAFQRRDIARLLTLNHGANFSVPGAGKTRVALAVFAAMRNQGKAEKLLVVGPKSAHEAWLFENSVCFAEPLRMSVLAKGAPDFSADVVLVNYERIAKATNWLASWIRMSPSMLILDEAHRMKLGAAGAYGAACLALGPLARRRLILTGTPAPNSARDLENLLGFVWPGAGKRAVIDAVDGGDLARASTVLRPLFTRTTKDELGLPPLEPKLKLVDLPPLHREVYDALLGYPSARGDDIAALGKAVLRMLMAAVSPSLLLEGSSRYEPLEYRVPPVEPNPGDSLYKLLRNLPEHEVSPKYEETVRLVHANASRGRKTLVWSNFIRSIATLEVLLAPYRPATVHGGTLDRDDQLKRFREDSDCTVLLSNPATLGEGISLHQVCHDAVYVDRDFTAGRYLQSLDRIHRLGLSPGIETNVTILAARNTIDAVVGDRLEKKLEFMGKILDDPSVQRLGDLEEVSGAAGMDAADVTALLAHLAEQRSTQG